MSDWLTVKEAAAVLRYAPDTMWRKIRRGEIPGVRKYGRSIRIDRAALFHMARTITDVSGPE